MRVAPVLRSTQKGERSVEEARDARETLPGMEIEAHTSVSLLETTSSTLTKLTDGVPEIHILESKDPVTWSSAASISEFQDLATRTAKAEAWETHAFEAQTRANSQPKQNIVSDVTATSIMKQKHSKEKVEVTEKEGTFLVRPLWPQKFYYILTLVGYSLRPTQLWNFVYLWIHKGGCSFFMIYIIILVFVGIPLLFLEMAVGQMLQQGSLDLWKIIGPWAGGVGYISFMVRSTGMLRPTLIPHPHPNVHGSSPFCPSALCQIPSFFLSLVFLPSHFLPGLQVCFITSIYMNVFNSWILFYLSHFFQFPVPWEKCPLLKNASDFDPACARTTPSIYFWYQQTLKASDRIEDGGLPVLSLSLPLFVSWCLIGVFIINGLQSIGKVMYVLVLLPYFILFCFLIRSLLLEGAIYGLQHLLVAKVSALYNVNVWSRAGSQVVFQLGLGFGPIVSLASHMPQSNNCVMDTFIMAVVIVVTLLLFTTFILSVLGFWATVLTYRCNEKNVETLIKLINLGKLPPDAYPPADLRENPASIYNTWLNSLPQDIKNMVLSYIPECNIQDQFLQIKDSQSFSFLIFAEYTSFLPWSALWSLLFFLLLLFRELGIMVGFMQGIILPLQDTFSSLRKHTTLLTGTLTSVPIPTHGPNSTETLTLTSI
ncbi:orphan sodium- and chloride-dependent neurotransmitter transporter NTT5 isoform X1 [Marmota marmota marmota]|uniref:orphan sodium- and chloride-dependent neurotransmitter transporter NTT5 isoform X1 n=1 Tax=Marmota marmota marmota TaxID=9994 RepID=UPI002093195E|nr:orphan sodium- and chloride-dependent neurotransmitter transporter NTT5 isoform X1 [Marmota marmota marmota]XP_048646507.1 orphan sodium- and chloride-dependent neurotransmitter transporter NTT5 isoform X1 [Marmota marmota marmota]XP_048646508.1 orphan sodium- and chloride-dependent neurotransmitter transporter NTT5 isoform X1 [Marmota marmota marmota]